MKIGFYSPYFASLAGGERYVLTLASHWSKTHDVSVFCDDSSMTKKAHTRLGLDLARVRTVENVFATRNIFKKMLVSRTYDLIFFLTDGSIPTTFAKYNILHIQVPFGRMRVHAIKLGRYQAVVCNSDFTRRNVDKRIGKIAAVIYPPVKPIFGLRKKKKMILSVGRFHPLKKQEALIEAFRSGVKKNIIAGYELVFAGGVLPADENYLKRLQTSGRGLPVRILPNIPFQKLAGLYNDASIYWHGAGYHESNPEQMEHFGISTVEAMSAGAVPVVYNGGGLPEIVREGEDGYLWANTEDLVSATAKIISSKKLWNSFSHHARERSTQFSVKQFYASFDRLLEDITG